ncbi:hypothetical protein OsI_30851 [Oryza sativa Indica Group]|uniref:Uncharacterized protein n=1 Tax=Oryza sativa subsp. indica TaxID=39946 RepID=B8BEA0_ORYSI|nr:hypothetical protein OsI_30851 [Oryza sativa Indica Group]
MPRRVGSGRARFIHLHLHSPSSPPPPHPPHPPPPPLPFLPASSSSTSTSLPPRLHHARLILLHLHSPSSPTTLASSAYTSPPLPPRLDRPQPMTPWSCSTPSAPPTPTSAVSIFRANPPSKPLPFFQAAKARPHGGVVGGHGHGEGVARWSSEVEAMAAAVGTGAEARGGGAGMGAMGGGTGRGAMGGVPAGACGLWFSMEESSREGGWWPPARADGDGGRKKMKGGVAQRQFSRRMEKRRGRGSWVGFCGAIWANFLLGQSVPDGE